MHFDSFRSQSPQQQDSTSSDDDPPLPIGRYLFYKSPDRAQTTQVLLPPGYDLGMWRPSLRHPWPKGATARIRLKFLFRTLVHFFGLFADVECGAVCFHFGSRLVHYSGFTPRYWRFPFLSDGDLQIGDTWTDPAHRRRGMALIALRQILAMKYRPGREFWYIVEAVNAPSIRVAERAGFRMVGQGRWVRPLGIKLFGSYVMDDAPTAASLVRRQT